jgi:nitrous oxidase accessory protein NosD
VGVSKAAALGVPWFPTANNDTLITITAPDVLVEGFSFAAAAFTGVTAIYSVWSGTTTFGDAPVIRNCYFNDDLVYGIVLNYVYNGKIYQNEFRCETNGACIYTDAAWNNPSLMDIYENRFWTTDAAIKLNGLEDSNIYRNSFYNSLAATPVAATGLGVDLANGNENHVFDNWFSCPLPAAIPGDWNDFNSASAARDAWVGNYCLNGLAVSNPV